jgi:MFS family permease
MRSLPSAMSNQQLRESAPSGRVESSRWIVLGVAVIAQMAAALVSQGIYTLIPFWKAAFHLSQASAALSSTVMKGGQILSMLFLGRAIDRHGERGVVGSTMVAMSLAAFGAAFASNYFVLLLFLTLLGAFYASVQPGGTRAIIRWFPGNQRGMATGLRQAALPLGAALAAVTLPRLAQNHGWPTALWTVGAFGIIGGVLAQVEIPTCLQVSAKG